MKQRLASTVLLMLFIAGTTCAQSLPTDRCVDEETIGNCMGRLNPSTFVKAAVIEQQQSAVAQEASGLPNVSGPATPALIDFLNLFAASVSDGTFNQTDSQYTFELNIPVSIFAEGDKIKVQSVFNRKPALDQTLQTKLDATGAATVSNALSDLDDVTISATYAPVSRSIGRTIVPHRLLMDGLVAKLVAAQPNDLLQKRNQFLHDHGHEPPFDGQEVMDKRFDSITDLALRGRAKEVVRDAALGEAANARMLNAAAVEIGVNRLYQLVANQPQLYFSVIDHQRKNLVGPDEFSGKLTYEWGSANLNRFLRQAGSACEGENYRESTCAAKFTEYVHSHAAAAETADRFSLAVEYARVGSNDIALVAPNPVVTLHADGSHQFTGTLAYGRVLRRTDDHRDTRLDVSGSYENFSNDPKKKDRGVISVIVTTKISDTMSLPFGVEYANHGTFLTDTDKKLNVHFGLIYRMKSVP